MFQPREPFESRPRRQPSKMEILKKMKLICGEFNFPPFRIIDGQKGLTFIFPLINQNLTIDEIKATREISEISKVFSEFACDIYVWKYFYNAGSLNDLLFGKDKVFLFIGQDVDGSMYEIIKQWGDEIDFESEI